MGKTWKLADGLLGGLNHGFGAPGNFNRAAAVGVSHAAAGDDVAIARDGNGAVGADVFLPVGRFEVVAFEGDGGRGLPIGGGGRLVHHMHLVEQFNVLALATGHGAFGAALRAAALWVGGAHGGLMDVDGVGHGQMLAILACEFILQAALCATPARLAVCAGG